MTDYVAYHKAEVMGYDALDVAKLAIYTKKPALATIGSRVWLVAGEGSPRRYRLRATFLVKSIEPSDKPAFKSRVFGTEGQLLDPMPILNSEPWFPAFLKAQGRFAFGFNSIADSDAQAGLRIVLRSKSKA